MKKDRTSAKSAIPAKGRSNNEYHARAKGSTAISISMSQELRDKIKAAADADDRSVSQWIALRMRDILEK